jgi:acyl dehydratase
VIGLKENSDKQTGVVYVRSKGINQHGATVLDYVRWVMVRKRDINASVAEEKVPELPKALTPAEIGAACPPLAHEKFDFELSGAPHRFADYQKGERIDHVDGMTVEEAEHMTATRLYQNTAKVHFNQYTEGQGRFGRRLIYGGHVISLARALSFNGLGNAFHIAAINAGRHRVGHFLIAGPNILQIHVLPVRPLTDWRGDKIFGYRAFQGIGHNERRRGQEIGPHIWRDAAFKIAIARQDRGRDDIAAVNRPHKAATCRHVESHVRQITRYSVSRCSFEI